MPSGTLPTSPINWAGSDVFSLKANRVCWHHVTTLMMSRGHVVISICIPATSQPPHPLTSPVAMHVHPSISLSAHHAPNLFINSLHLQYLLPPSSSVVRSLYLAHNYTPTLLVQSPFIFVLLSNLCYFRSSVIYTVYNIRVVSLHYPVHQTGRSVILDT